MKKIVFISFLMLIIGSLVFSQPALTKMGRMEEIEGMEEITPQFNFVYPKLGEKIKGKVEIKGRVKNALSVEFYYKLPQAVSSIYLGSGLVTGKNLWRYVWDTNLTPNGSYEIFARITNRYGEYESPKIALQIENEIEPDLAKEKELKQEMERAEKEIEQEEGKITEKSEQVEREITEKSEQIVEETKDMVAEEKLEEIEPEIEEKLEETREETKEDIKELVEAVKEGKKLKKEIEEKEKEKEMVEKEIEEVEKELEEVQEVKEKVEKAELETEQKQAEILEKVNKEKLESKKEEKKKLEKELVPLKKKKGKSQQKKKKIKMKISKGVSELTEKIEEVISQEKKPQILEIKKKIKEEVSPLLENLESEVSKREEIKREKIKILTKDSDKDGLSDKEEIRLGTDSFNPDTDQDGFVDGNEYLIGYDPLKPGPADKIIYQNPRKVKPKQAEVYKVERVKTITLPTGQLGIKIEGKSLPNSFVTIYIFSYAIVMTTKTDINGNWAITLDKPLADGKHEVYVALTNNQGEITARSNPFVFIKSGKRMAEITLSALAPAKAVSPAEMLEKSYLIFTIGIILFVLGIILIIIGILTRKRKTKSGQVS